jgi:hypothetical protein
MASPKQIRQRKLWQALGYSYAITGYLKCWLALLKSAGMDSAKVTGAIEIALAAARHSQKAIRFQMKELGKYDHP